VVTIDHFGNLITNIESRLLPQAPHSVVLVGGQSIVLRRTYADVRPGDYLALVNSSVWSRSRAPSAAPRRGSGSPAGAPVTVSARHS
jgi:hypothetical protein